MTAERIGNVPFNETTCGRDAYRRGAGQKVVGFSFYGDVNSTVAIEKGYFDGIVGNLKLMPVFYPGNNKKCYPTLENFTFVNLFLVLTLISVKNSEKCI